MGVSRGTLRLLGWLATLGAGIVLAVLIVLSVIAWRLSAGPIDVTPLLQYAEAGAHRPVRLAVGRATLAWNGWRDPASPVILAVSHLDIHSSSGIVLGRLDDASVSVRPADLLRWRLMPAAITAEGGSLDLRRRPDGELDLTSGFPLERSTDAPAKKPKSFLRALERVHLSGLAVTLFDEASGRTCAATGLSADISRGSQSSLTGTASATLAAGAARTPVLAIVSPDAQGSRLDIRAGPLDPSTLAPLLPPLGAWHAATSLTLSVSLDHGLVPRSLLADAVSGAGTFAAPGAIPIAAAHAHFAARLDNAAWHPSGHASLDLAVTLADPGAPGPVVDAVIALDGDGARGGLLAGTLDVRSTPLAIPRLRLWWPPGVANGARAWSLENLPKGTASNIAAHIVLASRDGAAGLSVGAVTGGFDGTGVALHWLRPIPPIENARAHLQVESIDSLSILLQSGHQGPLDVAGTRMRITGLSAKDQPGDINARIRGPLAAVLSVLGEKRLHLLSRQPLPLNDPSGTVDATLHVALPLDDRVTMDQVTIGAHVTLAHVHLGDVALGHSIDDGKFVLDAGSDGLTMRGNAGFAGLPITLAIDLDFRGGPPDEITEHVHAGTLADQAAIRRASTEFGRVLGGVVALSADYKLSRDRQAALALDADLASASIATPFGWGKEAGPPAILHADLSLDRGRLSAIDNLRAHGPDLDIASHGIPGPDGLAGLALDRIVVGRTRAGGRLDFPAATGGSFRLALAGSELDLSSVFAREPASTQAPGPSSPRHAAPIAKAGTAKLGGQPWSASLDFARVTLANHVEIGGVRAGASGSGAHLRLAQARATGPVPMTGSLKQTPAGRSLDLGTADAGQLLTAFDLTDRVRQGSLSIAATLTDGGLDDGIDGTVRLDNFTLLRVPAVVLLLRDLTVYGLADPALKPNISVSRVTVPFRWRDGVLTLEHARASQPALGLTAKGTIDTRADMLDLTGTIVPAYILNTLPGRLPLVGHLFSPERGGGLFAATFSLKGPSATPAVSVNPLAALLPGMLRGLLAH